MLITVICASSRTLKDKFGYCVDRLIDKLKRNWKKPVTPPYLRSRPEWKTVNKYSQPAESSRLNKMLLNWSVRPRVRSSSLPKGETPLSGLSVTSLIESGTQLKMSVYQMGTARTDTQLECGPMPNVMAALSNIGGALCSTPQNLAAAQYWSAVQ